MHAEDSRENSRNAAKVATAIEMASQPGIREANTRISAQLASQAIVRNRFRRDAMTGS